ncbi:hypothetical protein [Bradyrhizobium sp.]|uniref:hypothetical protein n=1 Tax=Bradyrhizobium sp. TaxID=376 RepID=UPI000AD57CE1|nr:hypothetical protein [Bradyrhizobium sp.]
MASRILKQEACQSEEIDNAKQKQSVAPKRLSVGKSPRAVKFGEQPSSCASHKNWAGLTSCLSEPWSIDGPLDIWKAQNTL